MTKLITSGCIPFEIASKSNSRRAVKIGNRPAFIKSKPALDFAAAAKLAIQSLPGGPHIGPVALRCELYYRTRRRDLDAALLMDALQGPDKPILNDRQIKVLHASAHIDRDNPRVEWWLYAADEWTEEKESGADPTVGPLPRAKGRSPP